MLLLRVLIYISHKNFFSGNLELFLWCFGVSQVSHYNISAVLLQVGEERVIGGPESILFLIVLKHVSFSDFHFFDALFFF